MRAFAEEAEAADVEEIVLIGMGGSSLCAEVCRRVFAVDNVWIADSTVPDKLADIAEAVDPARTLIVVASKSGSTVEVTALMDFFYARATPILERPGERFVAITDPGTPLEQTSHERGFRRLWLAPADVGGRFSALSVFGTLPMELMGIDAGALRDSARRMAASCGAGTGWHNPGTRLGKVLFDAHEAGRDKLTFVCAPSLAGFALWAEQLVAESTGKHGVGIVPIVDEPRVAAEAYGDDRLFVLVDLADDDPAVERGWLDEVAAAGHPVVRLQLDDRHQLGAEFARWEIAVASVGSLLGINPFDQPDVQASKERTSELLRGGGRGASMSDRQPAAVDSGWAIFANLENDSELADRLGGAADLDDWMNAHLGRAVVGEYIALQAFIADDPRTVESLQSIRRLLLERLGVATTLGWGPAFLHSTGQLHKGGPDTGIFLQITADDAQDFEVPGAAYTFGRLARAQSLGDMAALEERGRRVVRVHLSDPVSGAEALREAIDRGVT